MKATVFPSRLATAILCGGLFCSAAQAEPVSVTATKIQGSVTMVGPRGGLPERLATGGSVVQDGRVQSGQDGKASLKLTPCSSLELGPNSSVVITRLQLVRRDDGVTARAAELTLESGSLNIIAESLQTQLHVPGAVITGREAVFSVSIDAAGKVIVTVYSGVVTITSASGNAVEVKGGSFAVISGGAVSDGLPVEGNPDAEARLLSLQKYLDDSYTLGLICDETLTRLHGEILNVSTLSPVIQHAVEQQQKKKKKAQPPTVVSPEQ